MGAFTATTAGSRKKWGFTSSSNSAADSRRRPAAQAKSFREHLAGSEISATFCVPKFMGVSAKDTPALMPWKDPDQARIPEIRGGLMAAIYYGQRCSGDFYDFLRVAPNRVLFGLFDIAGRIEHSRPTVNTVQQQFRGAGPLLFQAEDINESESILTLWIEINRAIMKSGGVHACPAFLGCYNEELGTLCYVNAGHPPGLIRDDGIVDELKATALPLGLFSHSVPDSSVRAMRPGNALLLVSKGMIEANSRGQEYGMDRVRDYLRDSATSSAHEICVGMLSRIRQFMGTAPTHNDVTALSVVRSA